MYRDYLNFGGPFPDRLHLQVLFGALYEELFSWSRRWSTMVDEELDSWSSTSGVGWTPGT